MPLTAASAIARAQLPLSTPIAPIQKAGPAALGEVVGDCTGAAGIAPTKLPCGSSVSLPMVKVIVTVPSPRTAADLTWAVIPGIVDEPVIQLAPVGDCISVFSVNNWVSVTLPLLNSRTRPS